MLWPLSVLVIVLAPKLTPGLSTMATQSTPPSPAVIAALKHLGSIANPEFYEKQRMRFSTWNTPRFISCYREDLEWLHLPSGLTERVSDLLAHVEVAVGRLSQTVRFEEASADDNGRRRKRRLTPAGLLLGHPPILACEPCSAETPPEQPWIRRLRVPLGSDVTGRTGGGR